MNIKINTGPLPTEAEARSLQDLLAKTKLAAIEPVTFSAERIAPGRSPKTTYEVSVAATLEEPRLFYRFDAKAAILGEDEELLAVVNASIVSVFEFEDVESSLDWAVPHLVRTASSMAIPHLREIVQSLAARLGHWGVLIPMALIGSLPEAQDHERAESVVAQGETQ